MRNSITKSLLGCFVVSLLIPYSNGAHADDQVCQQVASGANGDRVYIVCTSRDNSSWEGKDEQSDGGAGGAPQAPPVGTQEAANQGNAKEVTYHTISDTEKNKVAVADDRSGSCIINGKPGYSSSRYWGS